jgi:hypothetical protein
VVEIQISPVGFAEFILEDRTPPHLNKCGNDRHLCCCIRMWQGNKKNKNARAHIHTHAHPNTHKLICRHAGTHIHTNTHLHTHTHTCRHADTHIHTHTFTHSRLHTHIYTRTHTFTHTSFSIARARIYLGIMPLEA